MQEGLFNITKEVLSVEKIQLLEEKITRVIDKIKVLTEENNGLNGRIAELQTELIAKDEELNSVKKEMGSVDVLKTDINKLNSERDNVRFQVEHLLKELESVEL
jgi:chromosome segregation ATPase